MKTKLLLLSSLAAVTLYSADPVDYVFSTGDAIKASEMNSNFQKLVDYISTLQSRITSLETQQSVSATKEFVGISTSSVYGSAGFLGMNNACEVTYAGSKMCTAVDIAANTYTGTATGTAWINPSVVYTDADGAPYDVYGNRAHSCMGWRSISTTNNWGSTVTLPAGTINGTSGCDVERPVACCQ
jgi:hypothetical protein